MELLPTCFMFVFIVMMASILIGTLSIIYKTTFLELIFSAVAFIVIFTFKGIKKVKEMVYI